MKYHIKTYGCQMNKSDSERIASLLENIGYKKTDIDKANLVILNTCSVRQTAEDRVFGALKNLKKAKKDRPNLITAVTGCAANKNKKRFEDRADIVFDIKNLFTLPKILKSHQDKIKFDPKKDLYESHDYLKLNPNYNSKFHAYVPIMTGCNNFCSYCIVPHARGREYSRSCLDILEEIVGLVNQGYKAITLLGQNVNSYKAKCPDGKITNFPKLLQKINEIPGYFWIWFVSAHPKDMSDELIETMATCDKVCNYVHLPVQAGNDEILKSMNRKYTVKHYLNLINKVEKNIKEASLSTDTIVGFPGETKDQFEDTANLYKQVKFDMAYISQFSPRPGTPAAKMKDNVSHQEKKRRDKVLTDILKSTARDRNKKLVGKTLDVLVENNKNNISQGKTQTFKTVKFAGSKNYVGNIVKVKINRGRSWGLEGEII